MGKQIVSGDLEVTGSIIGGGTKLYKHSFSLVYTMKDTEDIDRDIGFNCAVLSTNPNPFSNDNLIHNGFLGFILPNQISNSVGLAFVLTPSTPKDVTMNHTQFTNSAYVPGTGVVEYTVPAGRHTASITTDTVTPL